MRKAVTVVCFSAKYYFMTGDVIFDSRGSRYWGLLPEEHIVGRAAIIWQFKDMQNYKEDGRFYPSLKIKK
jgi:signal peptidase I